MSREEYELMTTAQQIELEAWRELGQHRATERGGK